MTAMKWRPMKIEGAVEFNPTVHSDHRGFFVTPLSASSAMDAIGHAVFPVAQASYSRSVRGTMRGVHFTSTPPGMAKYVFCTSGRAMDFVVDLRTGSPTFGVFDSVVLDAQEGRALYLPVGLGHAFVALEDRTNISYLLSGEYRAENELAVSVFDPALGLPLPDGLAPVLSERDRAAPTLGEAEAAGLLPTYARSVELESRFARPAPPPE